MAENKTSPFSYLDIVVDKAIKAGEYIAKKSNLINDAVEEKETSGPPPGHPEYNSKTNVVSDSSGSKDKKNTAVAGDGDPNAPKWDGFSTVNPYGNTIDGDDLTEEDRKNAYKKSSANKFLTDLARFKQFGTAKSNNELDKFSSKNYLWTFAALSNDEVNFPDETYRKNGPKNNQTVIKMGGGGIDQRPQTVLEKSMDPDPRFRSANGRTQVEYFIDNVEIKSNIAPNPKSRSTNAFNIEFEVTEPYSMGQFLQHLQLVALQAGYNNYLECPYLLQLDIIGYTDETLNPKRVQGPRRQIAVKIYKTDFDVNEGGSRYSVACSAFNEEALNDQAQSIPKNITISGRTVQEICQTGINSLASVVNTAILETAKKAKQQHEPDEIIILFPTEQSEVSLQKAGSDTSLNTAIFGDFAGKAQQRENLNYNDITQSAIGTNFAGLANRFGGMDGPGGGGGGKELFMAKKEYVDNRLGFSIKRNALSEKIKSESMTTETTNGIGKTEIFTEGSLQPGTTNFAVSAFAYDDKTKTLKRNQATIDPKQRTIQFKGGTKIQRIIEELVLISDFGKGLINDGKMAADPVTGMIDWFKIETSTYVLDSPQNEALTGRHPRIYVYKVVPYQVHQSVFMLPNDPPPGYAYLRSQACKQYDYIYTGQNHDVLDFEINFTNAFFTAIANDFGNRSANNDTASSGVVNEYTDLSIPQGLGSGSDPRTAYFVSEYNKTQKGEQTRGAVRETPAVRTARAFQDALVNSPADLINASLTIMGDPYFLTDSGTGNYNSSASQFINITQDGTMNYQNGSVDIIINFKTPIDIDEFGARGLKNETVKQFSGLYSVYEVNNSFRNNQFTQELLCYRRQNQDKNESLEAINKKLLEVKNSHQKKIDEAKAGKDPEAVARAQADANMDGRITGLEIPAYKEYKKLAEAELKTYNKQLEEYNKEQELIKQGNLSERDRLKGLDLNDVDQAGRIRGGL